MIALDKLKGFLFKDNLLTDVTLLTDIEHKIIKLETLVHNRHANDSINSNSGARHWLGHITKIKYHNLYLKLSPRIAIIVLKTVTPENILKERKRLIQFVCMKTVN